MSASSTPIKAAFKFLKTHSKKEKSRITITSISKEKRDDDDAVNSIGPTSGETSSGSSDEQVILVSHDPPHCSVDPSSTCIDKNIPNYLSTPSDSNVLALPWNKDQVEEKTAFSIEEEKPSYYKVMTCGLDTFFDSLFFTPTDDLGNDNGGKIINNINGHSNTVALQQNFEQGSPTNAEAEGDDVEDTSISMRNSNITTSEKVESQTHQYIHGNNSHGLTSSKCLEQNPNCNEFATVYHSYRVHSQFCKEILSKTYTTIPCFFEANKTKRAIHVCSEPMASNYNVRSQNYIQNGSKEPSKDSLFAFLGMDSLLNNNGVTEHASSDKFSFRNQMKQASRTNNVACPFLLVINWIVPWGNLQTYFCRPIESQSTSFVSNSSMSGASAGEKLWNQFLTEMTDEERNLRLKLIPQVVDGPWMLKKMIGSKPALLGSTTNILSYHGSVEEGYLEISINVTKGSQMANTIANACKGASDSLTVDLVFVVEGKSREELPEQILCSTRLHHISMSKKHQFDRFQWEKEVERRTSQR